MPTILKIFAWYDLAGGGAGFLVVDYDDIDGLTAFLQPSMELMSFDVRAIKQLTYDEEVEQLRQVASESGTEPGMARHDFA